MASIERISRVSVYHLRTGAYAQTHVDEIYVYNGLQSVLFVPSVPKHRCKAHSNNKFICMGIRMNPCD
jgi:hypothetical protein